MSNQLNFFKTYYFSKVNKLELLDLLISSLTNLGKNNKNVLYFYLEFFKISMKLTPSLVVEEKETKGVMSCIYSRNRGMLSNTKCKIYY